MAEKVRALTKPTERANLDISFFIGMALTPIEKNGNTSDYKISEVDCMAVFGVPTSPVSIVTHGFRCRFAKGQNISYGNSSHHSLPRCGHRHA